MRQESFMPPSYKLRAYGDQEEENRSRSRSSKKKAGKSSNVSKYSYGSQKEIAQKAAKLHKQGNFTYTLIKTIFFDFF